MITKLSHTPLYVTSQQKALDFYTRVLGFEVRTDATMENGYRWLTIGPKSQPDIEMILMEPIPGQMFDETAANNLRAILEQDGLGAGVLETDDCQATYEALKAKGVNFLSPPKHQPYGIEAILTDGCGHWYSLTQRR